MKFLLGLFILIITSAFIFSGAYLIGFVTDSVYGFFYPGQCFGMRSFIGMGCDHMEAAASLAVILFFGLLFFGLCYSIGSATWEGKK